MKGMYISGKYGSGKTYVLAAFANELAKEDYSWEALRIASQDWKEPVIVRGMFSDTRAVQQWPKPGGLESLADFEVCARACVNVRG
jgi:predicted ATPase